MKRVFTISGYAVILFLGTYGPHSLLAQSKLIDSLKQELEAKKFIDESYIDVYNVLTFEYLKAHPEESNEFVERALFLADSLQYSKGLFRATINKGSTFWLSGLYDQALQYYLIASTYNIENYEEGYAILYNNIAEIFKKKNQFDSALTYYYRAWEVAKKLPGRYPSILTSNIAELYLFNAQFDSANYYYTKSFEYGILDKNKRGKSMALFGLGEIEFISGRPKEAINKHKLALDVRHDINDTRGIIQSQLKLGEYYRFINQHLIALKYLDSAQFLAVKSQALELLTQGYYYKSEFYNSVGDYKQANNYLKKYQLLKDSIESNEFLERIEEIKSSMEAKISEKENQRLKENQERDQEIIRTQVLIIISIVLLLFVLSAFLYSSFSRIRSTRKNNEKLDSLNKVISQKNEKIEEINKQLDLQLSSSNKMLAEGQRITKLGSWEYTLDSNEMRWTDETFRQLGLEPGSTIPSFEELQHYLNAEDLGILKKSLTNIISTGKSQNLIVSINNSTGENKTISLRVVPEYVNGKLFRVYGSNLDITATIEDEKKEQSIIQSLLKQSKYSNLKLHNFDSFIGQLLKDVSDVLGVGRVSFWFYNREEKFILSLNEYYSKTDSYNSGTILKEKDFPSYFKAIRDDRVFVANNARSDKRTSEFSSYFAEFDIYSMLDGQIMHDGELVGILCFEQIEAQKEWTLSDQRYVGSLTDIISSAYSTNQNKLLEKEKAKLIDKLIVKNKNLEEFAYVISHNLRDPVSQILGLSDIYFHPNPEDVQKEIINRIRQSSEKLDGVINDLSIVLSNHEDKLELEEIILIEIIKGIKHELKTEIEKFNVRIKEHFDSSIIIYTSKAWMINIVKTVMTNSINYRSQEKQLRIDINCHLHPEKMIMEFQDNGIGLDMENYGHKVFRMYQRFHLDIEGKGIGLYIIKNQIESLGGEISMQSNVGVGTKITVVLPNMSNLNIVDSNAILKKY